MPATHTPERSAETTDASERALAARHASGGGRLVERHRARRARRGAVLVEFAMIALAFYILMAGTIELGRMIFAEQILQNAARVGARELATLPLPPSSTFQDALANPLVRESIYDQGLLAFEIPSDWTDAQLQDTIDHWPIVNRMLSPLMVRDEVNAQDVGTVQLLRYPGALLKNTDFNGGTAMNHFVVAIPQVDSTGSNITWHPVLEEVVPDGDPTHAPFSMSSQIPHQEERGIVALRINYPFQAASLVAYRGPAGVNDAVLADDSSVSSGAIPPSIHGTLTNIQSTPNSIGSYSGQFGLGALFAVSSSSNPNMGVRPFSRFLVAQSIFRREVFE
jgi:hypothetical protein